MNTAKFEVANKVILSRLRVLVKSTFALDYMHSEATDLGTFTLEIEGVISREFCDQMVNQMNDVKLIEFDGIEIGKKPVMLSDQDIAYILAALSCLGDMIEVGDYYHVDFWQETNLVPVNRPGLLKVATNDGAFPPPTPEALQELRIRLNCGE